MTVNNKRVFYVKYLAHPIYSEILKARPLFANQIDAATEVNSARYAEFTKLIEAEAPAVVFTQWPVDYHPDHRYVGVLVQDSAFMVGVPFFAPDVKPLKANPVFLFYSDNFQRPNPFTPDIAVSLDGVIEKKLDALDTLVSSRFGEEE